MNKIKESELLSPILFDPAYRLLRHLAFVAVIAVITFNQVFIAYQDSQNILGNQIYLICLTQFVLYVLATYFNYFYLTPKFLLKDRHITYLIALCVIVVFLPILTIAGEYWIRNRHDLPHRITNYTSPIILIDNLAASTITAICICGVSAGMGFREWVKENNHVHRLEQEHLQSELNKLKGQLVAPSFLSRTLRKASDSVRKDPKKTTHILIQLGQLLRYQLYDCNRDRILLKSEVDFLTRFLELERFNRPGFRFNIRIEGTVNKLFIAPFLFSPLVQTMMDDHISLDLFLRLDNGALSFTCKSDSGNEADQETYSLINQRLELQYPEKYSLISDPGMTKLVIDLKNDKSVNR